MAKINVNEKEISIITFEERDYISLTDMAKAKEGESRAADVIKNWIRTRYSLEFLETWEQIKPLLWLLVGHYIFFIVAFLLNGFYPLHISLFQANASDFQEAFTIYFVYINPFRRLEISLPGYLILLDLLMRVWSSYMIYNLIRASRRFIS